MFCSNCGAKSNGGNFCVNCGAKLSADTSIKVFICSSCGIKLSQDESEPCPGCGDTSQNSNHGSTGSDKKSMSTVMCSSCGIKISNVEGEPCPGCGHTSQNTKPVIASSVTKTDNDLASSESTLRNLMGLLGNATFALRGLVNVESGDISFRAQKNDLVDLFDPLNSCDDCGPTEEGIPFFVSCKTCSRSPENYFWIKSGDGDGVYSVI